MKRRDLLQLFGVGAAVVPIIGGLPVPEAQASLIEVPKVKLFEPLDHLPTIMDCPPKKQSAVLYWRNADDTGTTYRYRMSCFMIRFDIKAFPPLMVNAEFVVSGEVMMVAVK